MKTATNSGWASSLFRGELEIPVAYLLTHQEELQIARRIRLSLARLRQLLPRHPLGYRRFLSRMEEVISGQRALSVGLAEGEHELRAPFDTGSAQTSRGPFAKRSFVLAP